MKNKTPLQELLDYIDSLEATAYLLPIYEWLGANKERLLEDEREMVANAWDTALLYDNGIDPDDYSQKLGPASELGLEYYDRRYVS